MTNRANEQTLQQIMNEHRSKMSQKIVRRKLRAMFKNHEKNDRWTFRKNSREYNALLTILNVNKKSTTKTKSKNNETSNVETTNVATSNA